MPFAQGRGPDRGEQADAPRVAAPSTSSALGTSAGAAGRAREARDGRPAPDFLRRLEKQLHAAAARAAAFIRDHEVRLDELTVQAKSPADFVSEVDHGAEGLVRESLLGAHPDAAFLGEESAADAELGDGLAFVVDPLDGTTNFLHGYPWYAVSIGALWRRELVAGVVLNVPTGETYHATLGGGAWRNGQRIHVARNAEPSRALVGTGFPFKHLAHLDVYQRQFAAVTRRTAGLRRAGSAALDLCDVACGRFDAFWELTLAPWDVAAGLLLVREAGGHATDLDGRPAPVAHGPIVAGSPALHGWLLETLREA